MRSVQSLIAKLRIAVLFLFLGHISRMTKCWTVTLLLSGVVLAGLGYILYTPLPPKLGNWWKVQFISAKIKFSLINAEIQYRLGLNDRLASFRDTIEYNFKTQLTEDDKAMLEIYDTVLNGVSVRVYKPKSATGPLPGLVFYHGGGWVVLSVPAYDGICAHIAKTANIIVISVEYRLAPEFPFPAGFDDCVQVALYALKNGDKIGLDPLKIAVGGDSAGGNLAAAVALKLRDDKVKPPLKSQLLIYGVFQNCDLTLPSYSFKKTYGSDDSKIHNLFIGFYLNLTESQTNLMTNNKYLTSDMQQKCDRLVDFKLLPKELLPKKHERPDRLATSVNDDVKHINTLMDDPRIAPLMAEDLTKLPSSFVMAVGWDNLRDENIIYAERLKLAGNRVRVLYLPDSFHGILNAFDSGFDAGPKTMTEIISFLREELK